MQHFGARLTRVLSPAQRQFEIFDGPPSGLPRIVKRTIGRPINGTDWSLAHELPAKGGLQVWAVPGRKALCLLSQERRGVVGAICADLTKALAHGLAITLISGTPTDPTRPRRTIVGIAPRGVDEIRAIGDRRETRIKVVAGAFFYKDHVSQPPDRFMLSESTIRG